jgi:hypothetical protein
MIESCLTLIWNIDESQHRVSGQKSFSHPSRFNSIGSDILQRELPVVPYPQERLERSQRLKYPKVVVVVAIVTLILVERWS